MLGAVTLQSLCRRANTRDGSADECCTAPGEHASSRPPGLPVMSWPECITTDRDEAAPALHRSASRPVQPSASCFEPEFPVVAVPVAVAAAVPVVAVWQSGSPGCPEQFAAVSYMHVSIDA